MNIWTRFSSIGRSIFHAVGIGSQRAAARSMLHLNSELLTDMGLTKEDIHRAISSEDPLEVIRAAREKRMRPK